MLKIVDVYGYVVVGAWTGVLQTSALHCRLR